MMTASYTTRYGYTETVEGKNRLKIMEDLVEELRDEQFDLPDDEHTQVSISNEDWSVTAQVSGLISFGSLAFLKSNEPIRLENKYLRDIPDETLFAIWIATIEGDAEEIATFGWKSIEDLPEYTEDYYRLPAADQNWEL